MGKLKVRAGPSGLQFFNRSSGLTVLLDEATVPACQWSKAPRHVSIALTNACDLHCSHCFAPKTKGVLDPGLVAKWLVELDLNGCVSVGFGGGEPTLHPYFSDICRFAASRTRMGVTCTTHGHFFDEQVLASLDGTLNYVRISMDGVGATYEIIRGRPFASLCRRIKVIGAHTSFGINYLINSVTFPDLETAVSLAHELGASQFLLLPEQPVKGRGGIDSETVNALQEWVSNYRGNVPLAVSQRGSDELPTCDPLPSENGLRAYAHIDANGFLKASSFDAAGIAMRESGFMHTLTELESGRTNCEDVE